MKPYKKWSGEERLASAAKSRAAIEAGIIPPAIVCQRCSQTEGIIMYHNHDYSDPIKFLEAMCWRCHMIFHSYFRKGAREAVNRYWAEIKAGKRYPPVFKHDFEILRKDHGIE